MIVVQIKNFQTNLHDGASGPHFGHDAARTPHVDRRAVIALPEQKFRGPIPECDDPVRVPVYLPVATQAERPSKLLQV